MGGCISGDVYSAPMYRHKLENYVEAEGYHPGGGEILVHELF